VAELAPRRSGDGLIEPPLGGCVGGYSGDVTEPAHPRDDVPARRRQVSSGPAQGQWRRGLIGATASPSLGTHGEDWDERHWSSRALHRVGEVTAHAGAGLIAAAAVLAWLVVGLAQGFPDWWETVLYATSSSVTLVMVFAIQHTQTRQQSATQRKLDELLRAQPAADDSLIAVEEATDGELQARADLNLSDRQEAAAREG
jgi:low affinity Fe/Cu permease